MPAVGEVHALVSAVGERLLEQGLLLRLVPAVPGPTAGDVDSGRETR